MVPLLSFLCSSFAKRAAIFNKIDFYFVVDNAILTAKQNLNFSALFNTIDC